MLFESFVRDWRRWSPAERMSVKMAGLAFALAALLTVAQRLG